MSAVSARTWRAAALFAVFPLVALLAPVLARETPWIETRAGETILRAPVPFDPDAADLDLRLQPPGPRHLFGTDELGRDVLARTLHGARVSVGAGLLASSLALLLGAGLGAAAGWAGGGAERGVLFLVNVVQALPALVLVVAGASFLPPSFLVAAALIALTGWTDTARVVRAEARKIREAPFVDAARASGASAPRLVLVHVLPHALPPAFALLPYALGAAVLTEAALSFLGLGAPPPEASWGRALAEARNLLPGAWWCVLPPAAALFLLILSARRLGDAATARDVQSRLP